MNVGCNSKQVVKFGFNEKVSKIDMVIRKQLSKISKGGTGLIERHSPKNIME